MRPLKVSTPSFAAELLGTMFIVFFGGLAALFLLGVVSNWLLN